MSNLGATTYPASSVSNNTNDVPKKENIFDIFCFSRIFDDFVVPASQILGSIWVWFGVPVNDGSTESESVTVSDKNQSQNAKKHIISLKFSFLGTSIV